jgi:hypothetical protein
MHYDSTININKQLQVKKNCLKYFFVYLDKMK